MAFAAGQSRSRPIERNVIQSNCIQKLQALYYFVHHATGDFFFPSCQLDASCYFECFGNWQRGEIGDGHAIHFHGETFRSQTHTVACGTLARRHVIHQPVAIALGSGLFEILLEISEDPTEAGLSAAGLAVQKQVLNLFRKFFERSAEIDSVGRRRDLQT